MNGAMFSSGQAGEVLNGIVLWIAVPMVNDMTYWHGTKGGLPSQTTQPLVSAPTDVDHRGALVRLVPSVSLECLNQTDFSSMQFRRLAKPSLFQ
jgi:hypothetical protein